jgi:hypothetical protein
LAAGLPNDLFTRLANGLGYGLVGLGAGLLSGLISSELEIKVIPNQGIWRSARSAIVAGLAGALFSGLLSGLLFRLGAVQGTIREALGIGLVGGLICAMAYGGYACLSHLALRLILYHHGRVPWNYARFLDYCVERIFLHRVGGGYIFVHRLLMEYFAAAAGVLRGTGPHAAIHERTSTGGRTHR